MSTFTGAQREAVEAIGVPTFVTAAAGSGKTRILVERYAELLRQGISARSILTLTFTTDAADEMRSRILKRMGEDPRLNTSIQLSAVEKTPFLGTLHSFCYYIINNWGASHSLPRVSRILNALELGTLFEDVYEPWFSALEPAAQRFLAHAFLHADLKVTLKLLFQKQALWKRVGGDAPWMVRLYDILSSLFTKIEACTLHQGLYGFDDLEDGALRILDGASDARSALREQFHSVIVDEFQDTSPNQWRLITHLTQPDFRKLFVVGDPKQSIYRFRNADVSLFYEAEKILEAQGARTVALNVNFRTAPRLLSEINRLSESLFTGAEVRFDRMIPGREEASGRAPLQILRFGSSPKPTPQEEMQIVADHVAKLLLGGTVPESIALLFRVSDRIPAFYEALKERRVPVACRQNVGLFSSREVNDLVSFLRIVQDPADNTLFAAFLRSNFVGVSAQSLRAFLPAPPGTLYQKALAQLPSLAWLPKLLQETSQWQIPTLLEALYRHVPQPFERPDVVLELLKNLLVDPHVSLSQAIEQLETWQRSEVSVSIETRAGNAAVQLMTTHSAKGLEFDHVFLVDLFRQPNRSLPAFYLEEGFPAGFRYRQSGEAVETETYKLLRERQMQKEIEEGKRLLYVALTRARETLTIALPQEMKTIPKGSWGEILMRIAEGSTSIPL